VLKPWLDQLRKKLRDKSRFREAFVSLYAIVYLKVQGTVEERTSAVSNHIQRFKQAFSSEGALLEYFMVHWEGKAGKRLSASTFN
jgi:hypothetical protein